eukprot:358574-Chlamydomonas_euryale.AAC.5
MDAACSDHFLEGGRIGTDMSHIQGTQRGRQVSTRPHYCTHTQRDVRSQQLNQLRRTQGCRWRRDLGKDQEGCGCGREGVDCYSTDGWERPLAEEAWRRNGQSTCRLRQNQAEQRQTATQTSRAKAGCIGAIELAGAGRDKEGRGGRGGEKGGGGFMIGRR